MSHKNIHTLNNPDSPPQSAKIVVVGAGMSGLYSTWRLINEKNEDDIVILEASERTGGRLDSDLIKFPDGNIVKEEQGGMRFLFDNMDDLMALFMKLDLADMMRTGSDGRGQINILASDKLMSAPGLYATFLLWLLSELFEELPEVGDSFAKGDEFGTLESVKAVSEFNSPVNGEVIEVNERLEDEPNLVNDDPYGEGWLVKVSGSVDGADCDDFDDTIYPGATEIRDLIDQDCDTDIVETFADTDGDGTPDCVDQDGDGEGDFIFASDLGNGRIQCYDVARQVGVEVCDREAQHQIAGANAFVQFRAVAARDVKDSDQPVSVLRLQLPLHGLIINIDAAKPQIAFLREGLQ